MFSEADLIAKYRTAGIVKGTLKAGRGSHKGKNTVQAKCKCGHVQIVATSDLWLKNCCKYGEKLNRTRKARSVE